MIVPIGMAMDNATAELVSVPDNSTAMPKCASENSGVHWLSVRNDQSGTCWKNTHDSFSRT